MATKTKTFTTVGTPRVERSGQSVVYTEIAAHAATSLSRYRVTVHSNAYADQSWGRVERWDGTRWHEVVSTTGESLSVGRNCKLYVMRAADLNAGLFAADRLRLLVLADEVVGGAR